MNRPSLDEAKFTVRFSMVCILADVLGYRVKARDTARIATRPTRTIIIIDEKGYEPEDTAGYERLGRFAESIGLKWRRDEDPGRYELGDDE